MAPAPQADRSRSWGLVDLGAGAAVLLAAVGVIWSPKLSNAVAQATGGVQPVRVLVDVRGVPVADPAGILSSARSSGKLAIVIRNQPHGSVLLQQVIPLTRRLTAVQPTGSVVTAADPNQQVLPTLDARFVLKGQGRKTGGGVVFGNQTIKIGAPIELEGESFRVLGTVTGLQIGAS
jgi:hypothetical protein